MHRNLSNDPGDGSDGRAPTEAWLFAQAVLDKPIPKIVRPEVRARAKRAELEELAQFSSRHAEELSRLQYAEAEARHDRERLEWAAQISTEAEDELRELQEKEAAERQAWRRAEQFVEMLLEGRSETRQSQRQLEHRDKPYLPEIVEWNADQPRQPKGTTEGGQWAPKGGGGFLGAVIRHNQTVGRTNRNRDPWHGSLQPACRPVAGGGPASGGRRRCRGCRTQDGRQGGRQRHRDCNQGRSDAWPQFGPIGVDRCNERGSRARV